LGICIHILLSCINILRMAHHSEDQEIAVLPPDKAKIKKLWTVAGILGILTAVEFLIAFSMSHGVAKTTIFVLMTIVKAGYIVGEFMHLKYEVKVLFWSIMVPIAFIAWMLLAFLYEGFQLSDINFLKF
jgi:cytochrome c oxidase subunit IV